MNSSQKVARFTLLCERLLYVLVTTLIFEGLIRKIVPSAVGLVVFFLKDILCLYTLYLITVTRLPHMVTWLSILWKTLAVLFIPLLIYTAFLDLPLSIFAAKQYLLYVGVGILVPLAFPSDRIQSLKRFTLFFALTLIPTTLVAILQNSLPSTHWLNLTVGGDSVAGFSAAGFLRVSSTFSFTGQYSWFLNAVCAFTILNFLLPPRIDDSFFSSKIVLTLILGILLIIGVFITGGRTAVLGNVGCVLGGFVLSSLKSPVLSIRKGLLAGLFLIPSFWLLHAIKPQFFGAYEARSSGTEQVSHGEEIQGRILDSLLDWTNWYGKQDVPSMLIGNGLGIMSNGSNRISDYANKIRANGFWTEGDVPTTVWEGGIYLLFVWYGFRLAVIFFCFRMWQSIKNPAYSAASSFLLANVIINGAMGTIGMQPPQALWWWLSVGSVIAIHGFEAGAQKNNRVASNRLSRSPHSYSIANV